MGGSPQPWRAIACAVSRDLYLSGAVVAARTTAEWAHRGVARQVRCAIGVGAKPGWAAQAYFLISAIREVVEMPAVRGR